MIDKSAFHSLSYGMYVIGTRFEGSDFGCVANTFAQVTSSPLQVSVALNKENATTAALRAAGRFTASCLSEDASMELIGTFGFHSSTELDKFAQHASSRDAAGMPYVAEACCAWFSAKVTGELDLGTHVLFIGERCRFAGGTAGDNGIGAACDLKLDELFKLLVVYGHIRVKRGNKCHRCAGKNGFFHLKNTS